MNKIVDLYSKRPITMIIITIIILIIIIWWWKKYGRNLFQSKTITPQTVTLQNGQTVTLNSIADLPQQQKTYLEDLAGKIKTDITGANISHNLGLYTEAAGLSDVEIDYLAQYYKRSLTNGTSLYNDMYSEALKWLGNCLFADCSGWDNLLVKLEKTGNR